MEDRALSRQLQGRERDPPFRQDGPGLGQVGGLAVLVQVPQVGPQGGGAHGQDSRQGAGLVVRRRFPGLDGDGAAGTFANAGAQAVAGDLAHQPGLAFDHLQRALRAAFGAKAAAVTFRFVDSDDLAFHGGLLEPQDARSGRTAP